MRRKFVRKIPAIKYLIALYITPTCLIFIFLKRLAWICQVSFKATANYLSRLMKALIARFVRLRAIFGSRLELVKRESPFWSVRFISKM